MKKNCVMCGKSFIAKRKKALCCSGPCRCKNYYYRNPEKSRARGRKDYYIRKEVDHEGLRKSNLKASRVYKKKNREKIRVSGREYQKRTKRSLHYHYQKYFSGNRQKIIDLYCGRCAICSNDKGLVVHHIDGSGDKPTINNEMNNLILLCRSCHAYYHYRGQLIDDDIVRSYVKT